MAFSFQRLAIPEVILAGTTAHSDDRGSFWESYRRSIFVANGIPEIFVQDNQCRSVRGVIRALHYQKNPSAQGKLISALRGEIYDVAVDIRRGSPTFGHWVSATLSEQNHQALYVPPGFAHGYCVVSEEAIASYKTTAEYAPQLERGVRWNDPALNIPWPMSNPKLHPRDQQWSVLADADVNFEYSTPTKL